MRYSGYKIEHEEDGYFWQHGGYSDTVDEIKQEIDDWNAEDLAHEIETYGAPYHLAQPS